MDDQRNIQNIKTKLTPLESAQQRKNLQIGWEKILKSQDSEAL